MTTAIATNDLSSEAFGRIEGYVKTGGDGARVKRLRAANNATGAKVEQAYAEFRNAIRFADNYDKILDAALTAIDSSRYHSAHQMIKTELDEHVRLTKVLRPQFGPETTKHAFQFLHEQLLIVMSDVRSQEKNLKGITSPRDALSGGAAAQDAWQALEDRLTRYADLRRIQRNILINLGDTNGDAGYRIEVLNRSGILTASFDHDSYFTGARSVWRTAREDYKAQAFNEWLTHPPRPRFTLGGNDILPSDQDSAAAYLRWISADDKAWIPDEDELFRVDELAQRMLDRSQPTEARTQAKRDYYDGRSIIPAPAAKVSIV